MVHLPKHNLSNLSRIAICRAKVSCNVERLFIFDKHTESLSTDGDFAHLRRHRQILLQLLVLTVDYKHFIIRIIGCDSACLAPYAAEKFNPVVGRLRTYEIPYQTYRPVDISTILAVAQKCLGSHGIPVCRYRTGKPVKYAAH